MKRRTAIKGALVVAGVVVLVGAGALGIFQFTFPRVGPPSDISVEGTPERLERGAYLVNHVAACTECHGDRDWKVFTAPVIPGTEGCGGERFGPEEGFPGVIYPSNITPYALGSWTDGEILRAITEGVDRNGRPLFPFMPYEAYRHLSHEDAMAIIAYLRTLKPCVRDVPPSRVRFPMNLVLRTLPQPATLNPTTPRPEDGRAYGEYLVTLANCKTCHTPVDDRGRPLPGLEFAGGHEFTLHNGQKVRSANITPHPQTGIGRFSRDQFIALFKSRTPEHLRGQTVPVNTVMPWPFYAGMTEEDLGAIYDYLMSLPPVDHQVEVWPGT